MKPRCVPSTHHSTVPGESDYSHMRTSSLSRIIRAAATLEISPIGHEVAGDVRAQAERGAARGPVVVKDQRVARKAHLATRHRQERSRRHRERHTASARALEDSDIDERAARAAAAFGVETSTPAHAGKRGTEVGHREDGADA